jgi:hypothetical protein
VQLTDEEMEAAALADYRRFLGKVIRLHEATDTSTDGTIPLDPPAMARVVATPESMVLRWMDGEVDVIDPIYDISLCEPHRDLPEGEVGTWASEVYGPSIYRDGRVEPDLAWELWDAPRPAQER